jgi:hypothetical protein
LNAGTGARGLNSVQESVGEGGEVEGADWAGIECKNEERVSR